MVDKAFRAALRNFSTLFLIVAVITVPLHLLYGIVFQNVIETRELHSVIQTFPETRQVRSVGRAQLMQARVGLALVTLIELAVLPFLARAARRVLRMEEAGEVATVGAALRAIREEPAIPFGLDRMGPVLVAAAIGFAIGFAIERTGLLLLEFVSDESTFPFFGLMQGVSRAAGAPFLLAGLALLKPAAEAARDEVPPLY